VTQDLNLEIVDYLVLRESLLQQLAQTGNIPLTVAQVVDQLANGLLRL
jgi:hypothetical protein